MFWLWGERTIELLVGLSETLGQVYSHLEAWWWWKSMYVIMVGEAPAAVIPRLLPPRLGLRDLLLAPKLRNLDNLILTTRPFLHIIIVSGHWRLSNNAMLTLVLCCLQVVSNKHRAFKGNEQDYLIRSQCNRRFEVSQLEVILLKNAKPLHTWSWKCYNDRTLGGFSCDGTTEKVRIRDYEAAWNTTLCRHGTIDTVQVDWFLCYTDVGVYFVQSWEKWECVRCAVLEIWFDLKYHTEIKRMTMISSDILQISERLPVLFSRAINKWLSL